MPILTTYVSYTLRRSSDSGEMGCHAGESILYQEERKCYDVVDGRDASPETRNRKKGDISQKMCTVE